MKAKGAQWRRGWTAAALAAAVVVAGPMSMAAAHDELTGTEPADGASTEVAPEQVRIDFSGDIAAVGTFVTVTGPLGTVTDGTPQVEGTAVVQQLMTDVPPGEYTVAWRVTSQDGHPISGEFDYTMPAAGVEAQGEQAPTSDDVAATSAPLASDSASSSAAVPAIGAPSNDPDTAANTAAAPATESSASGAGTAIWVWGVVALALVTLGGLGAAALRRR